MHGHDRTLKGLTINFLDIASRISVLLWAFIVRRSDTNIQNARNMSQEKKNKIKVSEFLLVTSLLYSYIDRSSIADRLQWSL